jgi:hypothetical protein
MVKINGVQVEGLPSTQLDDWIASFGTPDYQEVMLDSQ